MQVRYDTNADRVLWQLRTFGGELFAVWLTRRMLQRLWQPLQDMVTQAGIARVAPHLQPAQVLPEAREMLAQAARERALPSANFKTPFDTQAVAQPLGSDPLLVSAVDLTPGKPGQGLAVRLRDPQGRSLELRLSDDLATALTRLIEQALVEADWGFARPAAAEPAAPVPASSLN